MSNQEVFLVLHDVRSRENVGSIFRTADAAGVKKIYLCGITPIPPHQKISKTALGAEIFVSWEYHKQTWRLLEKLKKEKINIIALEQTKNSENIFKFKPPPAGGPLALILGNEVKGLSPRILGYCDKKTAIPMYGRKENLNVSVAAGIALYTILNT